MDRDTTNGSFHSTVLQRPQRDQQQQGADDVDDSDSRYHQQRHESRRYSDAGSATNAHRHSAFRLRSPTRDEGHHQPPTFASPSQGPPPHHHHHHHHHAQQPQHHHHHHHQSPPSRPSILHNPNPYHNASSGAVPPAMPPPPPGSGLAHPSSTSAAGHQHPASPLHPPTGYYPPHQPVSDAHLPRPEKTSTTSSFYDPLTDTTKERRVSDSYHGASQSTTPKHQIRDPFNSYQPPAEHQHPTYYNGNYTSPRASSSYHRPRSPLSHSHPLPPVGSLSPQSRHPRMASPSSRHASIPSLTPASNGTSRHSILNPDLTAPSPPKMAASTPSRAADPMSFSNILSSAEPTSKPLPRSPIPDTPTETRLKPERRPEPAPRVPLVDDRDIDMYKDNDETEPEVAPAKENHVPKKRAPKKATKGRASDIRGGAAGANKRGRRSSVKHESPAPGVPAAAPSNKRQANGELKPQKQWSPEMERKIQKQEKQLVRDVSDLDNAEFLELEIGYREREAKRRKTISKWDVMQSLIRREDYAEMVGRKLLSHSELGKRRYDDVFYDDALQQVREQELFAEKERKKDMQRKRRREKSMAVTMEQKEAALARANAASDETERQKHLRDAERANKKAQQTKLILQKGIKGPVRSVELNLEGGTMSSFQASDAETPSKKGKKNGSRPKKSKEQKQAEKDSAEAAQAAIDAGEELPAKDDGKVRIKIKNKSKGKDRDDTDDMADMDRDLDDEPQMDRIEDVSNLDKKFISKGYNQIYDQILRDMARKDVNKTFKLAVDSYATKASNLKKTAILASKEAKRWQLRTNKGTKDLQARAKRVMRDMMGFWKRNEREERDLRKAAEKQELENARKEEADREAARQKRKLNFLISQTELYSHFIGKKIKTDEVERSTDNPEIAPAANANERKLDVDELTGPSAGKVTNFENLDFDDEDESNLKAAAVANAQNAIAEAQKKAREFNQQGELDMDDEGEMNFQNPTGIGDVAIEQPKLLNAQLKEYQLKGLNWLVNLYEQGINGILADEMGLGKTIQSISVMAYLAEHHDIWGPFLVVAPASTLHNWQQEIVKFVPELKILPYWGSAGDRKVLRKFWDRKHSTYRKDAAFHVCVTSYQLVVSDVAYFQKMRWQYMILDEAQAIKSSQSSRWKSLLGFHCRNRLLLTGTPIQNNMQELWALLHFIMPSLFDSHDEFSEWFSKDIESHAQSNTKLNEDQLKRLHMILKPFMLRRVKKHVQKELGDKIEEDVFCDLTYRQRAYYGNLRNQINIMDLVEKATIGDDQDSSTLMNLVMQFRKVCNHPDLFERAEVKSPYSCSYFAETASFVREGNNVAVGYSVRSMIDYRLPSLIWTEGGRLSRAGQDNNKAGWRNKALNHMMNVWSPEHVRENMDGSKGFSWLRFADASPDDVYKASHEGIFSRATNELKKRNRLGYMNVAYDEPEDEKWTPAHALFKIRERKDRRPLADITSEGFLRNLMNVAHQIYQDSGLSRLEMAGKPRATAPPIEVSCNKPAANIERENTLFNIGMRRSMYGPSIYEEEAFARQKVPLESFPAAPTLPKPDHEKKKFTNITVPSMQRFVTDSGKLAKLDELLFKLKNGGHRVLLYFQMTRMIDMMEEYLTYRNYTYCRLDGSTKLEDRRDTVHDFQTRPDIFIFLLSTRAGGLGINLTAADTVIFYDSDWNPTIDSQAMDRAHRLGQTRQVTVYRLITRGTIEERIRRRAMQKEEVQRVVIQGGGASVDFSGRRAPENRNRDIAMWLADDEQAEMIERREKQLLESGEPDKQKKKGGRKKKADAPVSLDEMYHEGEGHFDDGSKPSGTATPAESDAKGKKGKVKGSKRAKTTKQRLAIADGIDI